MSCEVKMLSYAIKEKARIKRDEVIERLTAKNLCEMREGEGKVFIVSDEYKGAWLEHAFDSVCLADYDSAFSHISLNQINLFLNAQKSDGQLPFAVCADGPGGTPVAYYNQIQECVSFATVCLRAALQNPDKANFTEIYDKLKKWDNWLEKYHSDKNGMFLTYCGFDTGYDNCCRLDGFGKYVKRVGNENASVCPEGSDILPEIMPDMNAVRYGTKTALSAFAKKLNENEEAKRYSLQADKLKRLIYSVCYDEKDDFFYDVTKNGEKRKIKSIALASLFAEKVLDKEEGVRLFDKYFKDPAYFGTAYPYPSVAVCDPGFCKNLAGNSWNYYSQGLTMIRTLLWMDDYGLSAELESNMEKWVEANAVSDGVPFGQELDPFTGKHSECSPYYAPTMLFYIIALKRLGI